MSGNYYSRLPSRPYLAMQTYVVSNSQPLYKVITYQNLKVPRTKEENPVNKTNATCRITQVAYYRVLYYFLIPDLFYFLKTFTTPYLWQWRKLVTLLVPNTSHNTYGLRSSHQSPFCKCQLRTLTIYISTIINVLQNCVHHQQPVMNLTISTTLIIPKTLYVEQFSSNYTLFLHV